MSVKTGAKSLFIVKKSCANIRLTLSPGHTLSKWQDKVKTTGNVSRCRRMPEGKTYCLANCL